MSENFFAVAKDRLHLGAPAVLRNATGTMRGMRMPRHITITVLIAGAVLGGGAGCTGSTPDPSSTQRPAVAGSPIPTPTATPSSYPIEELGATFTEFCVTFTHPIKEDATSALKLTSIFGLHSSYITQERCSSKTAVGGKPVRGHIRVFFTEVLTSAQRQQVAGAVGLAYPDAAQTSGYDVQGSAVVFTVTPAAGSRLSAGGYDTVALSKQETDAVGRILVLFGIRWVNDNHDVQVTYQGRKLTAAQLAQMRWILSQAAGVAPAAVRLLPFKPGA